MTSTLAHKKGVDTFILRFSNMLLSVGSVDLEDWKRSGYIFVGAV